MKKPEDTNVLFRILYGDFRTRYTILAPKEAVAAMKKVKRPVTEEKKNIAATHAVMDKVNLIGDKFQVFFVCLFVKKTKEIISTFNLFSTATPKSSSALVSSVLWKRSVTTGSTILSR